MVTNWKARDLLLPFLWKLQKEETGLIFDISLTRDGIKIGGYNTKTGAAGSFFYIYESELGSIFTVFKTGIANLIKALLNR